MRAPAAHPYSGRPLRVNWTVANQGLGTTDTDFWGDRVYLATSRPVRLSTSSAFTHLGRINAGLSYDRSVDVILPNGITGNFYLVVETTPGGGPFEFKYKDNNKRVVGQINVQLSDSPDLVVTHIEAPTTALDGDFVDITWTVRAQRPCAGGGHVDRYRLPEATRRSECRADHARRNDLRGRTRAEIEYQRTERFQVP